MRIEQDNGRYKPLLGYIPPEPSRAAVDTLRHRPVSVKHPLK